MTDSERKDTLTQIRELGEKILEKIEAQADSTDEKISSAAPRAYYSVSKVLLDVIALDIKQGRASKAEIANKLAQFRLLDGDSDKQLQDLLKQAQAKQAEIQRKAQFAQVSPSDIKDLIDIMTKIFSIVISAISAYKAVKELRKEKPSDSKPKHDRVENTKPRKQTRKRKRDNK